MGRDNRWALGVLAAALVVGCAAKRVRSTLADELPRCRVLLERDDHVLKVDRCDSGETLDRAVQVIQSHCADIKSAGITIVLAEHWETGHSRSYGWTHTLNDTCALERRGR